MAKTKIEGCYRLCFRTPGGGCAPSQGHFRTKEEALRWAGRRAAWVVWEPVFGEVRWTVKAKKAAA